MARGFWERTFFSLVTAAVISGCASAKPNRMADPGPVAYPIAYTTYGDPQPLSDSQLREIKSVVAEAGQKFGKVWFLLVESNHRGLYSVGVYFQAPSTAGRIRRGRMIQVNNEIPIDQRREVVERLGGKWPVVWEYVQVIAGGNAGNSSKPPKEIDLPFFPPKRFTEVQILKMVDVARAANAQGESATMPVRRIEILRGEIGVYFGWQVGPLNGRGTFVNLKQDGDRFDVTETGTWVS